MLAVIFVTHVQSFGPFLKICGQINREQVVLVETALQKLHGTLMSALTAPQMNQIQPKEIYLVHPGGQHGFFRRCTVQYADRKGMVKIKLIDYGNEYEVPITLLRSLDGYTDSVLVTVEPQVFTGILSRIHNEWSQEKLDGIRQQICNQALNYKVDETECFPIISLFLNQMDVAISLINHNLALPIPLVDQVNKIRSTMKTAAIQTAMQPPVNARNLTPSRQPHSSIASSSKQMIISHLGSKLGAARPALLPNVTSFSETPAMYYHEHVPPNLNPSTRMPFVNYSTPSTTAMPRSYEPLRTPTVSRPDGYNIPSFKSNTLMVGSRHQVYCSYIEDGPRLFSVHLKSSEQVLDQMMSSLGNCPLSNLTEKPSLGMACVARYSEDNNLYRAVIMNIKHTTCLVSYVDYGNSDEVAFNDIYEIPVSFLKHTIFAMRFSLSGCRELGPSNKKLNKFFESLVMEHELELVVRPVDVPPFVQYCDLYQNGHNVFDQLKDMANECPKFVAPPPLVQDELVIIRFVESPKKFYVQQKCNLDKYNVMMDKLALYCQKAPSVAKLQVGAVCATTYGQDKDCYRVEIMELSRDLKTAVIKIVDFGIVIDTNVTTLKTIPTEFLALPVQAIECCLEGFADIPNLSELSRDQLELLAEDAAGARRNFKVKIKSQRNDPLLVLNLIDDSTYPMLDLSTRMFKLSMPPKSFRHFEQQKYQKPADRIAPVSASKPLVDGQFSSTNQVLNSTVRESPSGRSAIAVTDEPSPLKSMQNETSGSNWDLTSHTRASTVLSKSSRWNSPIRRSESQEKSPPKAQQPPPPISIAASAGGGGVQSRLTQNWRESSAEKSVIVNSWRDEAARQERRKIDETDSNTRSVTESSANRNWRLERSPPATNGPAEPVFELRQPVREDQPQPVSSKEERRVKPNFNGKRERQPYSISNKHIIPRFNRQKAGNDQQNALLDTQTVTNRDTDSSGFSSQSNECNETDSLVDMSEYISAGNQLAHSQFHFDKPMPVVVCWWTTPLEFYVQLKAKVVDYKHMMDQMQQFYQHRSAMGGGGLSSLPVGCYIIARYAKDQLFYRAQVLDYRDIDKKYKILFVDVGNKTAATTADMWPLEQRFSHLERLAIQCRLDNIILNYDRKEIEDKIDNHLHSSQDTVCEFLSNDGAAYVVHMLVNGVSLRDTLLNDRVVSEAAADVDLALLVGQVITIHMGVVQESEQFKATLFASANASATFALKQPTTVPFGRGMEIPVRIDELSANSVLLVTPLLPLDPSLHITNFPVLQKYFHIEVSHVESINIVYIQNIFHADHLAQLLDDLFVAYGDNDAGIACTRFSVDKLAVAKSVDGNWYRCRIEKTPADDANTVLVRYIDYGNCEEIPKALCKEMLPQFSGTNSALACKAYLPFECDASINDIVMDELTKHTKGYMLDVEILGHHFNHWIVQISSNNRALSDELHDKLKCIPLSQVYELIEADMRTENIAQTPIIVADPIAEVISDAEVVTTAATPMVATTKPRGTPAYISHTDRPDRFYLQLEADQTDLTQLQEDIQIVAPSLPLLEDFTEGTHCIVKYSADECWYRAVIIDSDSEITSILFIDFGNTDTITDNSLIRAMNDAFGSVKRYAIPCALPVDVKSGGNEWSDEACAMLRSLLEEQITFEFLNQGERCSLVQLYHGDRDIMAELLQQNHAVRVPYIENGQTVYVSHVNSLNDFYVQMEKDTGGLEIVGDYLLDQDKFPVLTDFKVNTICSAQYIDDGLWYRAKILSHNDDGVEVYFIDYGNTSVTTQLRQLPLEIAELPHLSKCCALRMPKDIQYWSDEANQRFQEIADNGATVFTVNLIMPGSKVSVVDLIYKERNLTDELRPLCEQFSVSAIKEVDKQLLVVPVDERAHTNYITVSGYVSEANSSSDFYVQPEYRKGDKAVIVTELASAADYPSLENFAIGGLCAAKFVDDGLYYRAKVLSSDHDGCQVFFIDYGKKAIATDLRALPDHVQQLLPCAIHCTLQSPSQQPNVHPISADEFARLAAELVDRVCHFQVIGAESSQSVVRMFRDVQCDQEVVVSNDVIKPDIAQSLDVSKESVNVVQPTEFVSDPAELPKTVVRGCICWANSSSDFYVQSDNREAESKFIVEQLANAACFSQANDLNVGDLCAALFVDNEPYYRAKVIGQGTCGTEVLFIDYGNTAMATELRILPDNLLTIPELAIHCSVRPTIGGTCSEIDFAGLVVDLNKSIIYIQLVDDIVRPNIVRLFRDIDCTEEITVHAPTPPSPNSQLLLNDMMAHVNAQQESEVMFKEIIMTAANDATDRIAAREIVTTAAGDVVCAQLCWAVTSTDFYVHPADRKTECDLIAAQLTVANTFPMLESAAIGSVVAAEFVDDKIYYRAQVLAAGNDGYDVFFIDYGNTSKATDLRELPEMLTSLPPCAVHYTLQAPLEDSNVIPLTETDFHELCGVITDQSCYFKVLDATTTPIKVRMFTDEGCEQEVLVDPTTAIGNDAVPDLQTVEEAAKHNAAAV